MSTDHKSLLATPNGKKQNQVIALYRLRTFHTKKKPVSFLGQLRVSYQRAEGKLFFKFSTPTGWGYLS